MADQHFEMVRPSKVDHAKAGAVERVGRAERHPRLHPHSPQALLPVAKRLVEKFDMRHGGPFYWSRNAGKRTRSSHRVSTLFVLKSGCATINRNSGRLVAIPSTWN